MQGFSTILKSSADRKKFSSQTPASFFRPVIQPKLTINQPNDVYEQEADAMADKVMRMSDNGITHQPFFKPAISSVQRKCEHCEQEEVEKIQRKESSTEVTIDPSTENYISSLSGGRALDNSERSFFEPRFGYDFSNVKVHTDSVAAKSAQSINALAYTSGNNIVFNNGQYDPNTESGKRLLGHELTHVVQQKNGLLTSPVQRQPVSRSTACPLVVATQTYSRGNDDWAECNYETARIRVDLVLDRCTCNSSRTVMPITINYEATLRGKSFTGAMIPNPSGPGRVREQEGQASAIASGVLTPGRSGTAAQASSPMSLSESGMLPGSTNTSGPLRLTIDDARTGGIPGDPGDTLTQSLPISGGVDCNGSSKNGRVTLGGGFQVIDYDISADRSGALQSSISLTESGRMTGRIPTPLINLTAGGTAYPAFPGTPRPGGTGCTCDAVTGVQTGSRCNRGTGGAGFGKTP